MTGAGKPRRTARLSRRCAKLQGEDLFTLLDAAQSVAAKRLEAAIGALHSLYELGGDQHRATERLAKRLDARHLIDRRADDREVEPIDRADVAVQHVPKMEREIDRGDRPACGDARTPQRLDVPHRLDRGVERAAASLSPIRVFEREDGEHCVADELEHLATALAE